MDEQPLQEAGATLGEKTYTELIQLYDLCLQRCKVADGKAPSRANMQYLIQVWRELRKRKGG